MLQVPSEGTYEVAVTLVGVNGLRSESKSQEAATFEYAQMKMFDCAHTLMTKVIEYYYHKGLGRVGRHGILRLTVIGMETHLYGDKVVDCLRLWQ